MNIKYEHCTKCGAIGSTYTDGDEVHCLICGKVKYNTQILYRWKEKKNVQAKPNPVSLPKRC